MCLAQELEREHGRWGCVTVSFPPLELPSLGAPRMKGIWAGGFQPPLLRLIPGERGSPRVPPVPTLSLRL